MLLLVWHGTGAGGQAPRCSVRLLRTHVFMRDALAARSTLFSFGAGHYAVLTVQRRLLAT